MSIRIFNSKVHLQNPVISMPLMIFFKSRISLVKYFLNEKKRKIKSNIL